MTVEATTVNSELTIQLHGRHHVTWEPPDWTVAIVRGDIDRAIVMGEERLDRLRRARAALAAMSESAGASGK